jgi:hypothetical protein
LNGKQNQHILQRKEEKIMLELVVVSVQFIDENRVCKYKHWYHDPQKRVNFVAEKEKPRDVDICEYIRSE